METFLLIIGSFPTAVYTTALFVAMVLVATSLLGVFDLDLEADIEVSDFTTFSGFLVNMGFTGVPITIVFTLLMLSGWLLCYFMVLLVPFSLPETWLKWPIGAGFLILSFLISVPVTSVLVKPFKKVFKASYMPTPEKNLIGQQARVRSSRVDHSFGSAEVQVDGASLVIEVRSDQEFKTHDLVIIINKKSHGDSDVYQVVSQQEFQNNLNS